MQLHVWGLLALVGCAAPADGTEQRTLEISGDLDLLDDRGLPLGDGAIEVGEDLGVTLRGLARDTDHTLVVIDEDRDARLFTLAAPSDASGAIDRALLWPDLGLGDDRETEWFASRELVRAQDRLAGRRLRVLVEVEGKAIRERSFVVANDLRKPRIFALDDRGQIARTIPESGVLQLVGTHLVPGLVDVMVVANRAQWREGDVVAPVKSRSGEPLRWRVEVGSHGELSIPLDTRNLLPGAFQIALFPAVKPGTILRLDSRWVLAKRLAPGLVVRGSSSPPYWPGASIRLADISTRATSAAPFFTPEDVFLTGEPIWATLDLGPTHGASITSKVRFYVVPHRTAAEWRANAPLVDVSGHVIEALVTLGGTTGNRALIGSALAPGRYDIVVDTGNQPLNPSGFVSDGRFDATSDFVDGVTRVGFTIVDDPIAPGPHAVGITQYQAANVTYQQDENRDDPNTPTITTRVVGEVRYPAMVAGDNAAMASGTFPVVVVAHGNHLVYRGHDQLLAHLASHGYIAVSIDLIDLGSLASPPIDHRARLVLEHVALLSDPMRQPTVLKGHVDTANISLVGHSRGGDGALRAAYFAKRDGLAFHPRTVVAIAPTDGSGMPALSPDPSVIDVPYLALYGSDDADVGRAGPYAAPYQAGTAFRAYDRNVGPKAMVFVEGACHNLFNEERMVCENTGSNLSAAKLTSAEHLQLSRGYLTAFLAWHVQGDDLQRVFFETGMLRGVTATAHHQLHDPSARTLDNFEDLDPSINTAGGTNTAIGFAGVTEDPSWMLDGSSPHISRGRLMRWSAPGATHLVRMPYAIDLTASGDAVLSLRVAQAVGLLDTLVASAADVTGLDAAQLIQPIRNWITFHNGTVIAGAYVVVETPGRRWIVMNGAQHLRLVYYPNTPAYVPSLAIRNADIAETHAPLPIRLRLGDAHGVTRSIRTVVPAPVVPVLVTTSVLTDIDRRTLAALETIRIPIAAFAIPDASGPGVDPRQVIEVAIEVDSARGELLVDDLEIGP